MSFRINSNSQLEQIEAEESIRLLTERNCENMDDSRKNHERNSIHMQDLQSQRGNNTISDHPNSENIMEISIHTPSGSNFFNSQADNRPSSSTPHFNKTMSILNHHNETTEKALAGVMKRHFRRVIFKNGECNISQRNVKKRNFRFLIDIFTTVIDMKWRYTFLLFMCAFVLSWLGFAVVWWIICYAHGDFLPENLADSNHPTCVANVKDFTTALLFSVETQHTIGYGARMVTENCPEGIILLMFQSCFGVIIAAFMTGIIFSKLSRPKKRTRTLMFSSNAVICERDGVRILIFRVGDMRKSHFVCTSIRGILLKKRITQEGEVIPLEQCCVPTGIHDGEDNNLFLVWPVLVCHKINETSPFWDMSADDFARNKFELIIILEGVSESTGMTTQARCSYLPGEILWGYRFEQIITYQTDRGGFQMDYSSFNNVIPLDEFPQISASESKRLREEKEEEDRCSMG